MRLVLLRHGQARSLVDGTDRDRPLTPRGHDQARRMGRHIARVAGPLDRALVSGARRTRETWAATGLAAETELRGDLYLASETVLFAALPPEGTVILVGHNDGIGVLAAKLVDRDPDHPQFLRYPPCACLTVEWDGPPTWRTGRVIDYAVPADLPD